MSKKTFICQECSKEFETYLCGRKTVKYCSQKCCGKNRTKDRTSQCQECGKIFQGNRYKQIYCSHDCYGKHLIGKKQPKVSDEGRENLSKSKSGKNNPSWNGGKSPLRVKICNTYQYKDWRTQVFERDNYTCQECGLRGVRLNAHHIKKYSDIAVKYNINTVDEAFNCEPLWSLDNGITLCYNCHKKKHKKVR